jgi:uncharacterized protein YgiM (DUF1202 family)
MTKKKNVFNIMMLMIILTLSSCGEDRDSQKILLPSTPIISSEAQWAVVTTDYLRIRAKPTEDSEMLASTGKGTVVRIISQTEKQETLGNIKDFWYQIDDQGVVGWVFASFLQLFNSRSEALNYAKELQ